MNGCSMAILIFPVFFPWCRILPSGEIPSHFRATLGMDHHLMIEVPLNRLAQVVGKILGKRRA